MLMRRLVLVLVVVLLGAGALILGGPSVDQHSGLGWEGGGAEVRWSAVLSKGGCWRGSETKHSRGEEEGAFLLWPAASDELGERDHACSVTKTRLPVPPSFLLAPAPPFYLLRQAGHWNGGKGKLCLPGLILSFGGHAAEP